MPSRNSSNNKAAAAPIVPCYGDGLEENPGIPTSFRVRGIGSGSNKLMNNDVGETPLVPTLPGVSTPSTRASNLNRYASFGVRKILTVYLLPCGNSQNEGRFSLGEGKKTKSSLLKQSGPVGLPLPQVCVEVRVKMSKERLPVDIPQAAGGIGEGHFNMLAILSEDKPLISGIDFVIPYGAEVAVARAWELSEGPPEAHQTDGGSSRPPSLWTVEMDVGFVPEDHPPASMRPILKHRWYQVKNTVSSTMIGHRSGTIHEAVAVDNSSSLIFLKAPEKGASKGLGRISGSLAAFPAGQNQQPGLPQPEGTEEPRGRQQDNFSQYCVFNKKFTPARSDKVVRIRRHPNRFSDIVGTVEFDTVRTVIGVAVDEVHGDRYLIIDDDEDPKTKVLLPGGYSRLEGTHGRFWLPTFAGFIQHRQVLGPSTYYTPSRKTHSVRIREQPSLSAPEIGMVEPNEVKRAVAIHYAKASADEETLMSCDGSFVEWESGGFTIWESNKPEVHISKGAFLTEVPNIKEPLRCPVRFSATRRLAIPSPEILDLDKEKKKRAEAKNNKNRRSKRGREEDDDDDEEEEEDWLDSDEDLMSDLPSADTEGEEEGDVTPEQATDDPHLRELHSRGKNLTAEDLPRIDL